MMVARRHRWWSPAARSDRQTAGTGRRRRLGASDETDAGVLEQRSEDHAEAGDEEDVDALEVGDLGQRGVRAGQYRGHREHGGDAESDAGRRGVAVQPEGDPREDDDQTRRHVDVDDVVAETAHEVEVAVETRVAACERMADKISKHRLI